MGMNDNASLYKQTLSYRKSQSPQKCLTQPWWVRTPEPVYWPTHSCLLEPMICGKNVFGSIAEDIGNAQSSIEIITWGFDPGMVLVRGTSAQDGERFGDLLKRVATRIEKPVKVRILVWHDNLLSQQQMKNIPGLYGKRMPAVGCGEAGYYSTVHQNYNADWFDEIISGMVQNIDFRIRHVSTLHLTPSLKGEPPIPKNIDGRIAALYATHHQKMMLIDYECPSIAKGYVMGHNCVTDFWDTSEHHFQSELRERFYRDEPNFVSKRYKSIEPKDFQGSGVYAPGYQIAITGPEERKQAFYRHLERISFVAKPYQDISCRVRGPILANLNHNFCQAWLNSIQPKSWIGDVQNIVVSWMNPIRKIFLRDLVSLDYDKKMVQKRNSINWKNYILKNGTHSAQLLRTQPEHGEKSIKECYANITRQARNYIFIQNQYIQYQPWADHLQEFVRKMRKEGYGKEINIFIMTSTPERDGMDLHTYEVAAKIGQSQYMQVEHEAAIEQARMGKGAMPLSLEQMAKNGINAVMGSMWTCAKKDERWPLKTEEYEEIYIHAKVAIVDDAVFTLGSANLNLRSMAIDSELNILSDAYDLAYKLRSDLFSQAIKDTGPPAFGCMKDEVLRWRDIGKQNSSAMNYGEELLSQFMLFHVNRKPGSPII